jgi:hypothetical protein
MAKAFNAGFQRIVHRALPAPVGSRNRVTRYRHFNAACSLGEVAAVAATATVGVLPGFALGAMAGPIRADLHLSLTTIGLAMSAFYATTALTSLYTKRLAVRLPAPAA